jgi:hypothetical protein
MTRTEKLLSISSEGLGAKLDRMPEFLEKYSLSPELFQMLQAKNGFYTFEHALHVFPLQSDITGSPTFEDWNSDTLWRNGYNGLADGLLFFAEDVFADQFCLSAKQDGVFRFVAETGETEPLADSIEKWADLLLSNYEVETGWTLAHKWQSTNGRLQFGQRLHPKIPFVLGGKYDLDNLWAGDAVEGMLFKGDLASQLKDLPDGTQIRLRVKGQD